MLRSPLPLLPSGPVVSDAKRAAAADKKEADARRAADAAAGERATAAAENAADAKSAADAAAAARHARNMVLVSATECLLESSIRSVIPCLVISCFSPVTVVTWYIRS